MARPEEVLVAVDLGGGSGRVLAGRRSGGALSFREVHRFPNPVATVGGLLRWDLASLEASIRAGLDRLLPEETAVSVGIDSWGVDFVLAGADGQALEPARSYRNEHTSPLVAPVFEALDETSLYRRTGIQTQHFNTLFQLAAWQRAAPETLSRARSFAMVPDWLIHRLGAPLVNEVTNASTTQLLDASTQDWDRTTIDALGLPPGLFRKPYAAGSVLAPRVSLGRHRPALIAPATHDTASAVAATPLTEGSAYIATGTWCLIGIESDRGEFGEAARRANFTNEAGVDGSFRFLKNCMGLWLVQQLKASWPECPDFAELSAAAAKAEPFQALVDADDPLFFQPDSMKQALEDWWTRTGQRPVSTPGAYARCCLESLVLVFQKTLEEIEAVRGIRIEAVHLVGGGCLDTLLCQLTADATGLPVLAGPVEASALGNLALQARALGWVTDQAEARSLVARSSPPVEYRPRPDTRWHEARERLATLKSSLQGGAV